MSSEPLLKLSGIEKSFSGLTVLNGVNFELKEGEIIGLVGPNGSGKTSVINLISGVLRPEAGTIRFNGSEVQTLPSHTRVKAGINRSFQVPKCFVSMTVRENIEVAAHFSGHDADTPAILAEIGLEHLADKSAGALTANQQKMLDLGRALATRPKLLLVDEIGAGLNPAELSGIATLLKGIAARGVSLIVVEHLMEFLNALTDRVIVLSAGKIIFEGSLEAASRDAAVVTAFFGGAV
ncbi:ABC transporter ATP-binding protein [Thioclava sp.]|uniref:ABC transporter ATP-binding protein n=1 Tax=Thioclava sp. TaxID=1933450 RepID=UPI003AA8A606